MSLVTNARGDECNLLRGRWWASAAKSLESTSWFWAMWSFIGLVSMLDAYLVYRFLDAMPYIEENPICRLLIMLDAEHLSVFLPAKAIGTLSVLAILRVIFVRRREYSLPIIGAVAAYQAGLVVYLVIV